MKGKEIEKILRRYLPAKTVLGSRREKLICQLQELSATTSTTRPSEEEIEHESREYVSRMISTNEFRSSENSGEDFIEGAKYVLSNGDSEGWISVETRLPEATTPLESPPYQLAVVEYKNRTYVDKVAFYSKYKTIKEGFYDAEGELVKVIFWQPLPNPPQQLNTIDNE